MQVLGIFRLQVGDKAQEISFEVALRCRCGTATRKPEFGKASDGNQREANADICHRQRPNGPQFFFAEAPTKMGNGILKMRPFF